VEAIGISRYSHVTSGEPGGQAVPARCVGRDHLCQQLPRDDVTPIGIVDFVGEAQRRNR
jgi:hypothetical protein